MLKEIPVGPFIIPVEVKPAETMPGLHGQYKDDSGGPRIEVVDGDETRKKLTVAHELVHAWLGESGVRNVLSEKKTELICDALSLYVSQLIYHCRQLPPEELEEQIQALGDEVV